MCFITVQYMFKESVVSDELEIWRSQDWSLSPSSATSLLSQRRLTYLGLNFFVNKLYIVMLITSLQYLKRLNICKILYSWMDSCD